MLFVEHRRIAPPMKLLALPVPGASGSKVFFASFCSQKEGLA
jgi:hypothetical protein